MALFTTEEDLSGFLKEMHPAYERYAHDLWTNGAESPSMLANATIDVLVSLGLLPIHACDIKARSGTPAWLYALGDPFATHGSSRAHEHLYARTCSTATPSSPAPLPCCNSHDVCSQHTHHTPAHMLSAHHLRVTSHNSSCAHM